MSCCFNPMDTSFSTWLAKISASPENTIKINIIRNIVIFENLYKIFHSNHFWITCLLYLLVRSNPKGNYLLSYFMAEIGSCIQPNMKFGISSSHVRKSKLFTLVLLLITRRKDEISHTHGCYFWSSMSCLLTCVRTCMSVLISLVANYLKVSCPNVGLFSRWIT